MAILLQRYRFDVEATAPVLPWALLPMFPRLQSGFNLQHVARPAVAGWRAAQMRRPNSRECRSREMHWARDGAS